MTIRKGKQKKNNALNRKHSITAIMIMILMPVIIIASIVFSYMSSVVNNKNFYKGIEIGGIKADGKSKEAILKDLKVKFGDEEQKIQILLQYGDQKWIAHGKDINAKMDYLKKIDVAYQLGRSGNLVQRFFFIKSMGSTNHIFVLNYLYNVQELQSYINNISKDIELDVKDARVEFQPKKKQKFIVIPERLGRKVAMDQIIKDVNSKLDRAKKLETFQGDWVDVGYKQSGVHIKGTNLTSVIIGMSDATFYCKLVNNYLINNYGVKFHINEEGSLVEYVKFPSGNVSTTLYKHGIVSDADPHIGMTYEEVKTSLWGSPNHINRTTTEYGIHEQWVYSSNRYIYFVFRIK